MLVTPSQTGTVGESRCPDAGHTFFDNEFFHGSVCTVYPWMLAYPAVSCNRQESVIVQCVRDACPAYAAFHGFRAGSRWDQKQGQYQNQKA